MILRRARGILVAGLLWAAAWAVAGPLVMVASGLIQGLSLSGLRPILAVLPLVYGVYGFIGGVLFSSLLVLAERRRSFDELSVRRLVLWGALGSTALPLFGLLFETLSGLPSLRPLLQGLQMIAVSGMLGGTLAWGQLRIARLGQGRPEPVGGLLDG